VGWTSETSAAVSKKNAEVRLPTGEKVAFSLAATAEATQAVSIMDVFSRLGNKKTAGVAI
jgi:hypothetical protein